MIMGHLARAPSRLARDHRQRQSHNRQLSESC